MATERFNINDPAIDIQYFRAYADLIKPEVRGVVLDLGCGEGWLTKELADLGAVDSIIAVDKFGQQPAVNHSPKIAYWSGDIVASDWAFPTQFDTIVSTEFIEHITQPDLERLLDNIKFWLEPTGRFLGSTPDKLSPTTNPYHLQEYTKAELTQLFAEHGLVGTFTNPIKGLTVWTVKSA